MWDGGRSEWRKELYPDYKAQRDYGEDDEEKEAYQGLWDQIASYTKTYLSSQLTVLNWKDMKQMI